MTLIVLFIAAFGLSFALGFPVRWLLAAFGVKDHPNSRSSHNHPVVRGGGLSILVATVAVALVAIRWSRAGEAILVALACLVLAAVSFIDDLRSLPQWVRFAVQAGATIMAIWAIGLGRSSGSDFAVRACWLAAAFVWITGYTNAFNFMDGINGLAGMQAVVTGIGTALLGRLAAGTGGVNPEMEAALVLAGAAAGFLPHNFPRARMFMGDVGSAPLGFLLAILAVRMARGAGWWLLVPLGLLHANFILDTGLTLVRRLLKKERWYESHRDHFYQRLNRAGWSHTRITLLETLLQCVVVLLMTAYVRGHAPERVGTGAAVILIWLAFFFWAEVCFIRASRQTRG